MASMETGESLTGQSSARTEGPKPSQLDAAAAAQCHETCLKRKDKACEFAPFVKFMLEHMEKIGCKVDIAKHFACEPCHMAGAFDQTHNEVVLCENMIWSQREMDDTITHELIHAFDNCRAKVDFRNPRHLACTEIRAASLSGDCFLWKEWFNRLNFGLQAHHQTCVKRKAARSMMEVTDGSLEDANKYIDEVWDTCFHDTAPFDRIP